MGVTGNCVATHPHFHLYTMVEEKAVKAIIWKIGNKATNAKCIF